MEGTLPCSMDMDRAAVLVTPSSPSCASRTANLPPSINFDPDLGGSTSVLYHAGTRLSRLSRPSYLSATFKAFYMYMRYHSLDS